MQNNQVAEVHLSEEIEALLKVISCNDSIRIFNYVWPEINESIFQLFVLLGVFLSKFKIDRATVETTAEQLPRQNFLLYGLRKLYVVKMALVIGAS
jgi:hypothetical protein